MMIIDLSKYNVVEDWNKVKLAVSGVILRCAYRGYGSGKIVEDAKFSEFARACKTQGIPFGLYFMSQAITAEEGKEEAEFAISKAKEYGATLPIFIDSEDGDGTARVVRADGLSKNARTEVVKAFCDTVKESGYTAGVYASESWYEDKLHYDQLKDDYFIWVAKYGTNTGKKTATVKLPVCHVHQYTSKGMVSGIKGNVDLNEGEVLAIGYKKTASEHIQLNYQPGKSYKVSATGLRIRTKLASQDPEVLPNGKIIGTIEKGTRVKNLATARVGDAIWMYLGLNNKGQEQWICADTGERVYVE